MTSTGHIRQSIIFNAAQLFADKGFENVTLLAVANLSGIKAADIYNHFNSKDAILREIYDYYTEHILDSQPTVSDYEPILRTGTAQDIFDVFNYSVPEPKKFLFCIVRIIWARRYHDEKAKQIYMNYVIQSGKAFVNEVLNKGIEIGRINATQAEIDAFASTLISIRDLTASSVVVDPNQDKWKLNGLVLIRQLSKLLRINPPIFDKDVALSDNKNSTNGAQSPNSKIQKQLQEHDQEQVQYQVEDYLTNSIANVTQSAGRYLYYSSIVNEDKYSAISHFMKEMAENELDIAVLLNQLHFQASDKIPNLKALLSESIDEEHHKGANHYRYLSEDIRKKGYEDIADTFLDLSELSLQHEKRCRDFLNHYTDM